MKLKDWHVISLIYLVSLLLTLLQSINHQIVSDQLIEYNIYLSQIESSKWQYVVDNIVNSCPIVTYIPALIQRATNINPEILFKVYICILYTFMPVFVYLVVRKFYPIRYSLLSSLIVLFNYYYIYSGAIGRVSIAWAIFAGIVWAFVKQKNIFLGILMVLLVFTHYATAVIALASFMIVSLCLNYYKSEYKNKIKLLVILLFIVIIGVVWYFFIAYESGRYIKGFLINTVSQPSSSNVTPDIVVSKALGTQINIMNIPQKLELGFTWIITLMIIAGFLISFKTKQINWEYTLLSIIMLFFIQATFFSPYIGVHYGIARIYFTAIPVLAVYYIITVDYLFKKHRLIGLILAYTILVAYGLCTSGIIHRLFGIIK